MKKIKRKLVMRTSYHTPLASKRPMNRVFQWGRVYGSTKHDRRYWTDEGIPRYPELMDKENV